MTTPSERVKAGAKFLDEQVPGWNRKVDPHRLDMQSAEWCVLGQVFMEEAHAQLPFPTKGYYWALDNVPGLWPHDAGYGFTLFADVRLSEFEEERQFRELTELWLSEVLSRA